MKYFIASDIHGSAYYCEKMLTAFENENADKIILLGDILYHGPRNDLPKDYSPKAVTEMLSRFADKILCVRGNCDGEVDQMVLPFPIMADYGVLSEGGRLIYFTHGHNHNVNTPLPFAKGDILLHGHTHIPAWDTFGNENLYLNPGSVSIPKNNSVNSYMTLENDIFTWKDLDGKAYHKVKI